jgi:hypothetical protein
MPIGEDRRSDEAGEVALRFSCPCPFAGMTRIRFEGSPRPRYLSLFFRVIFSENRFPLFGITRCEAPLGTKP